MILITFGEVPFPLCSACGWPRFEFRTMVSSSKFDRPQLCSPLTYRNFAVPLWKHLILLKKIYQHIKRPAVFLGQVLLSQNATISIVLMLLGMHLFFHICRWDVNLCSAVKVSFTLLCPNHPRYYCSKTLLYTVQDLGEIYKNEVANIHSSK